MRVMVLAVKRNPFFYEGHPMKVILLNNYMEDVIRNTVCLHSMKKVSLKFSFAFNKLGNSLHYDLCKVTRTS